MNLNPTAKTDHLFKKKNKQRIGKRECQQVCFINQSHGPMFESLMLRCQARGAKVVLLSGSPISDRATAVGVKYFSGPALGFGSSLRKAFSWILFSARAALFIFLSESKHYVITTNPPLLLLFLPVLILLKRFSYSVLIYDVYPDALVGAGYISASSPIFKFWIWLQNKTLRKAVAIYTISPCLRRTINTHFADNESALIEVFPTWFDNAIKAQTPKNSNGIREILGIGRKFVVSYAGNLSATQGLDVIVEAAEKLRNDANIHFVFIGDGAAKKRLQSKVEGGRLSNVHFLPRQPKNLLGEVLTLGDCSVVSIGEGFGGISMPSKLYPAMAVRRPIIAITPPDTFLETVVRTHKSGFVVRPNKPTQLARVLSDLSQSPEVAFAQGENAEYVAETFFSGEVVAGPFAAAILEAFEIKAPGAGRKAA